jgi:hypothetical protein
MWPIRSISTRAWTARRSAYDLNGNLTAYRGQTLAYSSENRLEALSGAGVEAEFSYDAEGRRKRMLVGNTSTEFVHAGNDGDRRV